MGAPLADDWGNIENAWVTLDSETKYENRWIRVRHENVLRPDGSPGIYGVVEIKRPAVATLALTEDLQMVLVGQWRYAQKKPMWELPLGASEEGDPDFVTSAKRELKEEAGVEAATWTSMGTLDSCVGITNETAHLFLATDLTISENAPGPEEEGILVKWLPLEAAYQAVMSGKITESSSVVLILKVAAIYRDQLDASRS
jgi:8-oxo-dGTP pyrophosphatase MutT (NUDIX family)